MTTMTVRDIRLHWPKAEKALAEAGEIVVTRDSKPVAKIVPYGGSGRDRRPQFDAGAHTKWLQAVSKGEKPQPSTDEWLRKDREDD